MIASINFSGKFGAGEGNRTLVFSLEGCCSTIELHPRALFYANPRGALQWPNQSARARAFIHLTAPPEPTNPSARRSIIKAGVPTLLHSQGLTNRG
jgi:hypothetical protein